MVKGSWNVQPVKRQGGWGQEATPRPPAAPAYGGQKGSWKRTTPPPPHGMRAAPPQQQEDEVPQDESLDGLGDQLEAMAGEVAEDGDGETPAKKARMDIDETPRPGETERQAKVRIMAERIRAEAKAAREGAENPGAAAPATTPSTVVPPRQKVLSPAAQKAKDEKDAAALEAFLPKMEEKVLAAEDEAEKVTILAAPLSMEAVDELRELQMNAIRDTERAVKAAMTTMSKARREVEQRKKEAENFSHLIKESAMEEIDKMGPRLEAAQTKLDEHKSVRKDHEMALQAEKQFGELASRLAGVEIDCEKAAMMSEPLAKALDTNPHEINAAEIRESKESLRIAQAVLAPTMRLIAGKVAGLKGAVRNKMLDLQSRAEASQALLDKAQRTVEEAQSRAASIPILKQAQDRVAAIEDILQKMRETEAPFLMGIETMPPEEAGEVLTKMDKAAALAQSALADAHKYVALKAVEVGRLAEGAAEAARRELERVKQQLDTGVERVKAFQAEAGKRRRVNLVEVVKVKIEEAEAAITKMKEAGTELQSSDAANMPTALEKAHAAEIEAQNAVTVARRELQEKQQDLRPMEGGAGQDALKNSSDILRTKVRVNYMETELSKFRKLAKDFEEKIKVGKSLNEVLDSLKEAEVEVDRIAVASESWPKDTKPPAEAEKSIAEVQSKLSATTVAVENKLQTAQGLELKELRGVFGRLQKAQTKLDKVKDIARERSRALSMRSVKDASDAVQKAEVKVSALNATPAALKGMTPAKLEALHAQAIAANEVIAEAKKALGSNQTLDTAAKVEFARLQLRFKGLQKKGKAAANAISDQFEKIANETCGQVLDHLRSAARREDGSYDAEALFTDLSENAGEISETQFCEFFTKHKNEYPVPPEKVKLAYRRIAPHGLLRRTFVAALADFLKVVRDITITDEFEIQSAKKVRKLEIGEVIEALGETKEDSGLGLERVQCRAINDGTTGWVTVKSSAGSSYLERAKKPFLFIGDSIQMRESIDVDSAIVRELKPGEVVELVQGPREERTGSDLRVRGAACTEDTTGWLQVRDKAGKVLAKPSSTIYKCTEAIAMTDVSDFTNCEMVRRIDSGEALEMLSTPEFKAPEGGFRKKFRACRDGAEGWVTVQGSQGTTYVKQASKHYVCVEASPVHAGLGAESAVVKVLMPGEAFAAFEEPKEVSGGERLTSYSVRAVTDAKEGWVTCTAAGQVQPWTNRYKVQKTVALTKGFPANEAAEVIEVLRLLEAGELVDVTEQPSEDTSSGQLRLRCIALRDKAVGWVSIREGTSASSMLVRPATPEELKAAEEPDEDDAGEAAPTTPPANVFGRAPSKGGPKGGKRPFQVKQEDREPSRAPSSKGGYKGGKGPSSYRIPEPPAAKRFKGGKGKW